ncbi:hypothetical protein MKX08_005045 [Trichoderma sp. CBMAI-0020]|nr:hypothetical protein MKX08_005045 [Trichoderma sp. CBMAI-0020]
MRHILLSSTPLRAPSLATEIQFGIQVEFLAPPVSPSQHSQSISNRHRIFHYFASALQKSGLQAAFLLDRDNGNAENGETPEQESQLRATAAKGSIVKTKHNPDLCIMNPLSLVQWLDAGAVQNPLCRYWLLQAGSDIGHDGRHAKWQPARLSSPTLRESEANNLFPGINTALYGVWTAHPAKVHVASDCGLHVSVSPVAAEGLTVLQAQRVATLVIVLENNLLFHLGSPVRRGIHQQLIKASALVHAKAAASSSPAATANLPLNILHNGAMNKALNILWGASDLSQVRQMIAHYCNARDHTVSTALRITTHTHEDDSTVSSLEFCHAQASFSHSFVDNWETTVTTPRPEDSWKTLLKVLNDFAPVNWHGKSSELYWIGYLAVQDRK